MRLRLLLDTAEIPALEEWLPLGLFHGVTTNPTLLLRAGVPCTLEQLTCLTDRALTLGAREVHLQAWGADHSSLVNCGRALAALAPEAVRVKLPLTRAGILAGATLRTEGLRVTFTACYEASQALLAAALGADYVAPYLGRMNDAGRDGELEIIQLRRALEGVSAATRVLVASLRQPAELARLAAAGLDTFTLSPALAASWFDCAASEAAARQFEDDARAGGAD